MNFSNNTWDFRVNIKNNDLKNQQDDFIFHYNLKINAEYYKKRVDQNLKSYLIYV